MIYVSILSSPGTTARRHCDSVTPNFQEYNELKGVGRTNPGERSDIGNQCLNDLMTQ